MVADAVVSRRRWYDGGNRGGGRGKKKEKGKAKRGEEKGKGQGGTRKRSDMCYGSRERKGKGTHHHEEG